MSGYETACQICHEPIAPIAGRWTHIHSGDAECWTGDGSTAYPESEAGKS